MLSRATVPPAATLPSPRPPQQPRPGPGKEPGPASFCPGCQHNTDGSKERGAAICPRLCPYELLSSLTPSSLGLQDLVSHGQEEGSTPQSCW